MALAALTWRQVRRWRLSAAPPPPPASVEQGDVGDGDGGEATTSTAAAAHAIVDSAEEEAQHKYEGGARPPVPLPRMIPLHSTYLLGAPCAALTHTPPTRRHAGCTSWAAASTSPTCRPTSRPRSRVRVTTPATCPAVMPGSCWCPIFRSHPFLAASLPCCSERAAAERPRPAGRGVR